MPFQEGNLHISREIPSSLPDCLSFDIELDYLQKVRRPSVPSESRSRSKPGQYERRIRLLRVVRKASPDLVLCCVEDQSAIRDTAAERAFQCKTVLPA